MCRAPIVAIPVRSTNLKNLIEKILPTLSEQERADYDSRVFMRNQAEVRPTYLRSAAQLPTCVVL